MVSPDQNPPPTDPRTSGSARSGVVLVRVLSAAIAIETVIMLAATVWMFSRFFMEVANNVAGAALLTGIAAIITVWLAWTSVATYREKSWVRGSIVTWQILQVSVAVGIFQGFFEQPGLTGEVTGFSTVLAWVLVLLALVSVVLVFIPRVNRRLRERDA